MRKILTFLFAALMSVGMWAVTPQGEDTWDDDTKTLTVNSNLPEEAYRMNDEIEHVIISSGVTSIGAMAFYGCFNLTSITCHAIMPPTCGSDVFKGVNKSIKIYVPAGSVDTYKAAWAAYADQIEAIPPATVAVTGVTLSPTSATLTLGETETVTLTATVAPDNATDKSVTWTTSNEAVATVSNEGVVTAMAAGTATITVTATNGTDVTTDDQTATCTVTVAEPTYTVSLKEGTDDATSWQGKAGEGEYQSLSLPLTGLEAGTAVNVKYNGTKKVKSVKAKKKQ